MVLSKYKFVSNQLISKTFLFFYDVLLKINILSVFVLGLGGNVNVVKLPITYIVKFEGFFFIF